MQDPNQQLEILKSKDAVILNRLVDIKITNQEEQKIYEDDLISARQAYNRAEEMRKSLVDPLNLSVSRINSLFKSYTSKLTTGISQLSMALDKWRKEQSDVSEEKMMTEAEIYWQKVKEAKGTGEVVPLPQLNAVLPAKTSYANMGSVNYREVIDVQIVSPNDVERDLCEPSIKKIKARAESGITDIKGVVITKKFMPYTRLYK